jgi:glycosyltransferase involved in cell wall biosynthesis
MKLSVIIPAFNAESTISDQLEALLRQDWDQRWEIIVADNGSTDATRDIVSRYRVNHENVRLVDASQKRGPSFARNVGVQFAQGEFLAFCDADDEVDPNWVREIAEAIEKHHFVASRMDAHPKSDPQAAELKKHRQTKGLIRYTYVPYLSHAGASGLGIRKQLHEEVGGFDESFVYCEDCDYCWKVQLVGYPLHFAPEALIHVRHRETVSGQFRQGRNWGEYSVLLIKKYVPQGMPKPRLKDGLRRWKSVIKMIPRTGNPLQRQKFIWDFGYRVGHLIGTIRYRIIAL